MVTKMQTMPHTKLEIAMGGAARAATGSRGGFRAASGGAQWLIARTAARFFMDGVGSSVPRVRRRRT